MTGGVAARILGNASSLETYPLNELGQAWWDKCRIQALPSISWDIIQPSDVRWQAAIRRVAPNLLVNSFLVRQRHW